VLAVTGFQGLALLAAGIIVGSMMLVLVLKNPVKMHQGKFDC
jgi:hypothetical protein